MEQPQQRLKHRPEDRNGSRDSRVVEFELGEFAGMHVSLTVRPQDTATDFGAIARLADEFRMRLGTSTPGTKPPRGDVSAVYRSWAHPGDQS